MAADYEMNYSEIKKQHTALTGQLEELSSALTDIGNIEQELLDSGQWETADKKQLTDRFQAYIQGGKTLHDTGMNNADILSQVATTYENAEQG